ncbi:hypothetical protein DOTSEDRAFT_75855 [Dothistroma septosporum NZE10]|uniref:C2H2-type domain-containing protein n=1 Tax=Dothistroma septosporum (strain NZE10 / CBS 128990) TaxID=675120 RepID=N1PCC9_DOTSN|nr:hypothetical protein DOTSEDRAFT_75855 [Dothistroma septosporum NZE10]
MSSFNSKSTILFLLVITLATFARANPNGPNYDSMDWNWDLFDSVGGQFAAGLVACNQFNPMIASPVVGSSRVAEPPRRRSPSEPQPHWNNVRAPSAAPRPGFFSFTDIEYASVWEARSQSQEVVMASSMSLYTHSAPDDRSHHHVSAAARRLFRPQYQQSISRELDQAAGVAAHPPSNPSCEQCPSLDASNMYGYPGAPQAQTPAEQRTKQAQSHAENERETETTAQRDFRTYHAPPLETEVSKSMPLLGTPFCATGPYLATPSPRMLPQEITSNPKYHLGMANGAVGNMQGWARRASAIGIPTGLSINTTHLAPPEDRGANPSPTSASTTGSSTRPGSRRSREEMVGNFVCGYCKAGFLSQGELTHHLRSHTPYMSRQHVCLVCEKRFQYKKDLGRHAPKHDPNRKKYYCSFQGCKYFTKGFGRQDHLDRHLATQHRVDTPQQASHRSF